LEFPKPVLAPNRGAFFYAQTVLTSQLYEANLDHFALTARWGGQTLVIIHHFLSFPRTSWEQEKNTLLKN